MRQEHVPQTDRLPDTPPPTLPDAHLGLALEVESQDVFAPPCLALPDQEDTMGAGAPRQDKLGGLEPREHPMEPRVP